MAAPAVRGERLDTTRRSARYGVFSRDLVSAAGTLLPRAGRNGPSWFPTPLSYPVLAMQYLTTSRMSVGREAEAPPRTVTVRSDGGGSRPGRSFLWGGKARWQSRLITRQQRSARVLDVELAGLSLRINATWSARIVMKLSSLKRPCRWALPREPSQARVWYSGRLRRLGYRLHGRGAIDPVQAGARNRRVDLVHPMAEAVHPLHIDEWDLIHRWGDGVVSPECWPLLRRLESRWHPGNAPDKPGVFVPGRWPRILPDHLASRIGQDDCLTRDASVVGWRDHPPPGTRFQGARKFSAVY